MKTEERGTSGDEFLNKKELAARLKVCVRSVERWQHDSHRRNRAPWLITKTAEFFFCLLRGDVPNFDSVVPALQRPGHHRLLRFLFVNNYWLTRLSELGLLRSDHRSSNLFNVSFARTVC